MTSGDGRVPDIQGQKPYETKDVNFKGLMITASGVIGLMVIISLFSWALYGIFGRLNPGDLDSPFTEPKDLPAKPRLQPSPKVELREFMAYQDSMLNGYGWVNRDSGIAHIPIEQAMDMVLQKGLPVRASVPEVSVRREK